MQGRGPLSKFLSAALPGTVTLLAAVTLWEMIVRVLKVSPLILPAPSKIALEFIKRADRLPEHAWTTAVEAVVGLLIGVSVAISISFLISEFRFFRRALYPLIMAKQVVPVIVFAPILLVWFGYGMMSKIVIAALICFFPVVVNTVHGLSSVQPEMIDLAKSLGSSRWRIFVKLRFPHAMPHIYTAMRPTVALAIIGAVVGEFIGGNAGLGYLIVEALRFLNLPAMFAATIALVLLGLSLYAVVEVIGLLSLGWYRKALRMQAL